MLCFARRHEAPNPYLVAAAVQSRLLQAPLIVEADVLGPLHGPTQSRSKTAVELQAGSQAARPQQRDGYSAGTMEDRFSQTQRCSHLLRHAVTVQRTALVSSVLPFIVTRGRGLIQPLSPTLCMTCRKPQRRRRPVGNAAMYDNGVSAHGRSGTAIQSAPVKQRLQQTAQDFIVPAQPTSAGFWEDKPVARRGSRPLLGRLLTMVPFVRSWGGLL